MSSPSAAIVANAATHVCDAHDSIQWRTSLYSREGETRSAPAFLIQRRTWVGRFAAANSSEDILDLVREMMDRLDGRFVETHEDAERQMKYMALLRPGVYSYGAASKIGSAFLRRHAGLL